MPWITSLLANNFTVFKNKEKSAFQDITWNIGQKQAGTGFTFVEKCWRKMGFCEEENIASVLRD